jgi:tetratricopeptide (TPR) repeat protein
VWRACNACLLAALSLCGADWYSATTPKIEVYSDGGAVTARDLLNKIEQIRAIFREANVGDRAMPLRIFVFSSAAEYRSYHDDAVSQGFYRSGEERDYIALRAGPELPRSAFHEYVHALLQHSAAGLPVWFEEGAADFYSNLELTKGRVVVGQSIPGHVAVLKDARWFPADQLTAVTHHSPEFADRNRAGVFYAESWALVHMLNLAPQYRDGLPRFAELITDPRTAADAFRTAFGRDMDQALADLRGYLTKIHSVSLEVARLETAVPTAPVRLSPAESLLARGDLALHVDRLDTARELFEKAARGAPDSPEAEAGLGSRDASAHFELAMLARDSGAPRERVDELLHRVIAVNPDFAEAQFLLGSHASDDGHYEVAVERLVIAARLTPRRSYVWHALGFAQWKLGRNDDAAISAYRARATASTDAEEQAAITLAEAVRP